MRIGLALVLVTSMAWGLRGAGTGEPPVNVAVVDSKPNALVLVSTGSGKVVQRLPLPKGYGQFIQRPPRNVLLWEHQDNQQTAYVIDHAAVRVGATSPLGSRCRDRLHSADSRLITFECFQKLVTFDTVTGKTQELSVDAGASMYAVSNDRAVVAVNDGSELRFIAAPDLRVTSRVTLPAGSLNSGFVTADNRTFIALQHPPVRRNAPPPPSRVLAFDVVSGTLLRDETLDGRFESSQNSTERRHLYLTNIGFKLPKGQQPILQIRSFGDVAVTQRIVLNDGASWLRAPAELNQHFVFNLDETNARTALIVLDSDRVINLPMPGGEQVFLMHDKQHHRVFVACGVTISEFALPQFAHVADVTLARRIGWRDSVQMEVSPDGTRALWIRGDDVTVLDLQAHTAMPSVKLGTGAARTKQFVGDLAGSMLMAAFGETAVNSIASVAATFSMDGKTAYAIASTGELATIDVVAARVTSHRAGGRRLVQFGALALAISRSSVRVIDRASGRDVQVIDLPDSASNTIGPVIRSSRDGTRLLVGGGSTIHVLDGRTGERVTKLQGFGRVVDARFIE